MTANLKKTQFYRAKSDIYINIDLRNKMHLSPIKLGLYA